MSFGTILVLAVAVFLIWLLWTYPVTAKNTSDAKPAGSGDGPTTSPDSSSSDCSSGESGCD